MKSFILSAIISACICVFFMSLFDSKARHFIGTLPDSTFWIFTIVFFAGYLLSLVWGITGVMKGQRFLNIVGICFSLFGLLLYVLGFMLNTGGKEKPGQFEHDISKIEVNQKAALDELLIQTNVRSGDVQLTNYWGMHKNDGEFVICIQKGNVVALQVKNKPIADISSISKLVNLSWLTLDNCDIKSIETLNLPLLQRLEIANNKLTTLAGLEKETQLSLLDYRNNPITDSSAAVNYHNKSLYIVN